MQVESTRMYRVRDVAARFDVSVSTVYRAIESGQLDALKLGAGRGALRIPDYALNAYEEACGQGAYEALVTGGAVAEHDESAISGTVLVGEVAR